MASQDLTIQSLLDKLSSNIENLNEGCGVEAQKLLDVAVDVDFSLASYWEDVSVTAKKISQHCTKFCLSFMKPPAPKPNEISGMLRPLEECINQIMMLVRFLPVSCGKELSQNVTNASVALFESLARLLQLAHDLNTPALEAAYTRLTGQAWGECNTLQSLPRTNTLAVARALKQEAAIVDDAFREISESLEGDGRGWNIMKLPVMECDEEDDSEAEGDGWSAEDKTKLASYVQVIKLVKLLYKRSLGLLKKRSDEPGGEHCSASNKLLWKAADELRLKTRHLPELLDDLVLSMYPPVNWDTLQHNTHAALDACKLALSTLLQPGLATEDSLDFLTFVSSAVTHTEQQVNTVAAS
ncbi:hypothetical protein FHG87_008904 [Trinorchestia longiramus]|nr:hypothetical protein FHG87_008904 [Trinorchestia longiramus]